MKKNSSNARAADATWQAALKALALRNHSRLELSQKLRSKGHSDRGIRHALVKAKHYRLINDEAYALDIARREADKGRGPLWIKGLLETRGIETGAAQKTLAALGLDAPSAQTEHARGALAKLRRAQSALSPAQAFGRLVRLGHAEEIARQVTALEEDSP